MSRVRPPGGFDELCVRASQNFENFFMKFGGAQISRNFRRNLGVWPDFTLGLIISTGFAFQIPHVVDRKCLRKWRRTRQKHTQIRLGTLL